MRVSFFVSTKMTNTKAEIIVTSMKNRNNFIVLFAVAAITNVAAVSCVWAGRSSAEPAGENMSYLDNGTIRLGVDLNLGGSITYLADANGEYIKIEYISWREKFK